MSIKTRNAKKYVKMIKTKNYWDGEIVKFAISIQHYQSKVNELTINVNCNSHTLIHSQPLQSMVSYRNLATNNGGGQQNASVG